MTGDAEIPCKVTSTNPKGQTIFVPNRKVPEGYECTFTPKETGPHKIQVEYAGHEVPKSPVKVEVEPKFEIKKTKVKGLDAREFAFDMSVYILLLNLFTTKMELAKIL